jgi:hypothetical protein
LKSDRLKGFASVIIGIAFMAFVYGTYRAIEKVDRTQVSTSDGIYTSYVSTSKEIEQKAYTLTQHCKSQLCKVQTLLDFASNIPYSTHTFQQNSPQKTIQKNYGDCDDKSNLLISMLHAVGIEAYFVLVPKHIFVIVPLKDSRLAQSKGLWINDRKYYLLESTAKDSFVGFPLHYDLDEIEAIIEPFSNKKMKIENIKYKL